MTANGQEATSKWELKESEESATIRGLPVIRGGSREAEGTRKAIRGMSDHCDYMALCDRGDQNIHEQRRNLPTRMTLFSDVRMHTSTPMEVLVRDDSSGIGQ